jgi:hypothetical protein
MNGAMTLTLFVVAFALLIGYGYWWQNHGDGKRQREKAAQQAKDRERLVRARGWRYTTIESGDIKYRIEGNLANGAAWTIEYDSDHSSSSSRPKLMFLAKSLGREGWLWSISDRKTFKITQHWAARSLILGLAKLISLGSDKLKGKTTFFQESKVLPAGSAAFRERFVLVSMSPRYTRLVDHEVEKMILEWPEFTQSMSMRDNCISAELGPQGLQVQLYADAPSMAVIEHMVKLGNALASRNNEI